jgi:glycosyltransferase involved in cell wall biosynthesis
MLDRQAAAPQGKAEMDIAFQRGVRPIEVTTRIKTDEQPHGRMPNRIVFLISRADDIGGAQIHVRDVSTALREQGIDAVVLGGQDGEFGNQLRERGVPFRPLHYLHRIVRPREALMAVLEIRRLLREIGPDIVSTHSTTAGILGRLAARSLGIPVLFTAHGWGFTTGRPWGQRLAFWLAEWLTAPLAARIITVCDSDLQAALRSRLTRRARLVAIPNAMPDVAESLRATPEKVPPKIVMVARLSFWKDQPTLLRALAQLAHLDWQLELLGDGPRRQELETLADELGIGARVRFLGYRADVPARLADAQVFVLATKWEGFPRSILEALRAGLPVIASDVGGVRESVRDGETGFVTPAQDVDALRDRLGALLADPHERARMGAAARTLYEERFSLEHLIAETTAVYRSVLAKA